MGSNEMMRGFGSAIGAISIESIKLTFVSHDVAGEIVVGRVNVAVSMYDTVPRSNCKGESANTCTQVDSCTHINTAR